MASEYFKVSFNDELFLTSNGEADGIRCYTKAENIWTLFTDYSKTAVPDMYSQVRVFKDNIGKRARTIPFNLPSMSKTVGDALLALKADQDANSSQIKMHVEHDDFPAFDLDVEIMDVRSSEAWRGVWKDVTVTVLSYGEWVEEG